MTSQSREVKWHSYTAAGVLVALANEVQQSSSAWCAGPGKLGDSGQRCPADDAAGPCPGGCEVAGVPGGGFGSSVVPAIASVVVVLAVAVAVAYIYVDLKQIDGGNSQSTSTKQPGVSINVNNPLTSWDGDDDGDEEGSGQ